MEKRSSKPEDAARLRQKAEEILKKRKSEIDLTVSETDKLKLIHELEVHQIELELQNEELVKAKEKAEKAEEKHAFMAKMLDQDPLIIAHHDLNHHLVWANQKYLENINMSLPELKGKTCWQVWNLEKPCNNCPVLKTLKTGEKAEYFLTPENQDHWKDNQGSWLIRSIPVRDKNDKLVGAIETAVDLTGQHQAEKALRKSEERFELAMNATNDGLYDWDLKTNAIYYSPGWKNMLGYEDHELPNDFSVWEKVTAPEDVEKSWELQQKLISKQTDRFVLEFKMKHKDGHWVDILSRAKAIFNVKGKAIRIVGTHTDISERKRAEDKLKESEERYRNLVDTINSGVAIYKVINEGNSGHDFIIQEFNQFALEHEQMKKEEVVGKSLKDIRPNIDEYGLVDVFRKVWKTGEPTFFPAKIYIDEKYSNYYENRVFKLPSGEIVSVYDDVTEREIAELALKESEDRLSKTMMAANDGMWDWNLKTNDVNFDARYYQMAEYDVDEFPHRLEEFQKRVHPDDIDFVMDQAQKHFNGEIDRFLVEFRFKKKNGDWLWVMGRGLIVERDKNKKPLRFIGTHTDISQRKKTETELTKLSTAVEQSPSVIAITDIKGNLQYVNPRFTEITGYSLEEAKGKNPRILKSGMQSDKVYKELWDTVSSGKVWKGEFHNRKNNGELFWEMASVSPIFDKQGEIMNYIKVAEDITERKRNDLIQKVIHNISNAVAKSDNPREFILLVKKELGTIIDTSNFYVALYDESTDSIHLLYHEDIKDKVTTFPVGKTLTKYVIKTRAPLLATKDVKAKLEDSGEVELLGFDSKVWLGVPLFAKGRVSGVITVQSYDDENAYTESDMRTLEIISDQISISLERKKAEQDLKSALEKAEESNRLKTAFLNNMSHEIRTPLNGITGFIGLLQDSKIGHEEKQKYLDIINKSSDRLIATVTDIMDVSRIEAGEVMVSKTEVSVNEILEEQYTFFCREAESKGIELYYKSSLSDSEARVVTDKHKLEGILTNLIKNAIKFTDQGKITIACSLKKEKNIDVLEFYVKDSGIGIPTNKLESVFNRFEQADIGNSRAFEGSGLGLTIAKSYIEMLGGKIWVESVEGEGSKFYFTLPYISETIKPDIHTNHESTEMIEKPSDRINILLVEDDEISAELLKSILKDISNTIIHASSGEQAIELCKNNQDIDVILMDIKMPGISGLEATRRIREFNTEVIIIAQTAFAMSGNNERAIEAGCNDYITKPVIKKDILEKIKKHLIN